MNPTVSAGWGPNGAGGLSVNWQGRYFIEANKSWPVGSDGRFDTYGLNGLNELVPVLGGDTVLKFSAPNSLIVYQNRSSELHFEMLKRVRDTAGMIINRKWPDIATDATNLPFGIRLTYAGTDRLADAALGISYDPVVQRYKATPQINAPTQNTFVGAAILNDLKPGEERVVDIDVNQQSVTLDLATSFYNADMWTLFRVSNAAFSGSGYRCDPTYAGTCVTAIKNDIITLYGRVRTVTGEVVTANEGASVTLSYLSNGSYVPMPPMGCVASACPTCVSQIDCPSCSDGVANTNFQFAFSNITAYPTLNPSEPNIRVEVVLSPSLAALYDTPAPQYYSSYEDAVIQNDFILAPKSASSWNY